jgi:hypothetical protein
MLNIEKNIFQDLPRIRSAKPNRRGCGLVVGRVVCALVDCVAATKVVLLSSLRPSLAILMLRNNSSPPTVLAPALGFDIFGFSAFAFLSFVRHLPKM